MRHAMGIGRLGLLALGLGIGAALAATPGVASADPSTDPFSWIAGHDLGDLSVPAADPAQALDMQISIDGMDLFPTAGNTATATSGMGDIAIAIGNGADSTATGGIFDSAFADGTDAQAYVESTGSGNNFDTAIDIGNNSGTDFSDVADGSYDTAVDIGNNTSDDGPFAGFGNDDTAIQIGSNTGSGDGPMASDGNYDTAVDLGNYNVNNDGSFAGFGDSNLAYSVGNYSSVGNPSSAYAGGADSDLLSNDNIAYVLDPTGTDGSFAEAGANGSTAGGYDLAAVLGVDNALADVARGAPYLYDIVTALGNESGTAASTSGGFLADLLSLF